MADGVFKKVPVEIKDVTGRLIEGIANLPVSGCKKRLSDFINDPEKTFIPLTNAIVYGRGQGFSRPVPNYRRRG
ncbi:MAG: hypothetical protein ABIH68_01590 [bacterium]